MMATLQTQDANILDADAINWRLIVYPLLVVVVLLVGGLALYYYQQNQRDEAEEQAREAILTAKTPEALVQVADQFPGTTQAVFALISAANLSFDEKNYATAEKDYHRVVDASGTDSILRESAQIGLASTLEADNRLDDAIQMYLTVAHRGNQSPYAPYAYAAAARLYEQTKNTSAERQTLMEAAGLGGNSDFTKEAQARLKTLNSGTQTPEGRAPAAAPPSAPAASVPSATPPAAKMPPGSPAP